MSQRPYNVLFLCTGNSARSILAEVLVNRWGAGKFVGYSAGSFPKDEVNPLTLRFLRKVGLPTEGLRSKSWDELLDRVRIEEHVDEIGRTSVDA